MLSIRLVTIYGDCDDCDGVGGLRASFDFTEVSVFAAYLCIVESADIFETVGCTAKKLGQNGP